MNNMELPGSLQSRLGQSVACWQSAFDDEQRAFLKRLSVEAVVCVMLARARRMMVEVEFGKPLLADFRGPLRLKQYRNSPIP
jgi:hypothetical protein